MHQKAKNQFMQAKGHLGVYFHIPFCASTCDFCAFYQEKPKRPEIERYLKGMQREMEQSILDLSVDTVFWGGGTPGLLPGKDLAFLGEALLGRIKTKPCEWTVEMAPSTVKREKLEVLKALGVNRISMGVQSFDPDLLKSLGRLHSPQQVYQAYDLIREAGFDNVNLDLIFSIPGQDDVRLERDLHEAVSLNPDHLSAYCLTFEEDTALYIKLSQGKVSIDRDREEQHYRKTWNFLGERGFEQYEVSNFAKAGRACLHNTHTWEMQEWIGVGPSASSQYQGKRYTNIHSIDLWLQGLESGQLARLDEEELSPKTLILDCLIFGLRMNGGVDLKLLEARYREIVDDDKQSNDIFASLDPFIKRLEYAGLLTRKAHRIQPTENGLLVADRIAQELMEVF